MHYQEYGYLLTFSLIQTGVQGDVREPEDAQKAVEKAVAKFGSLSILVNAAAGNFLVTAEDLSTKGFKVIIKYKPQERERIQSRTFDS